MTKEQIIKSKIYSPGLIGGEVVTFLQAPKNTFYVTHQGKEGFLKDDNNKFVLFNIEKVVDARYLYLTNSLEQEKENRNQSEIIVITNELLKKKKKHIDHIQMNENWLIGVKNSSGNITIDQLQEIADDLESKKIGQPMWEHRKKQAEYFFEQNTFAIDFKNELLELIKNENWNKLYSIFRKKNNPITFKTDGDLTALINTIGANVIENTIEKMKESSLYLEAKVKVEKMYYPNE